MQGKTKFRFLPDIATADLAFEAFGKNYNELFENAGLALEDAMVKLESIESRDKRKIKKEEKTLENLLFSYLEELVYLKDANLMVFNRLKCEIKRVNGGLWTVDGELFGEKIDPKRHKLGVDVKAVTKHLFKIEKLPNKTLRAQVILDV